MKKILIALLLLAAPACGLAEEGARPANQALTEETAANQVTVKVTYKNPNEWRPEFEVTMDSRFVDLRYVRFSDVAILYDDLGGTFIPTEVKEDEMNGVHHLKAIVRFGEANASSANSFDFTIQRVADVGIMSFKFATRKGLPGSGF